MMLDTSQSGQQKRPFGNLVSTQAIYSPIDRKPSPETINYLTNLYPGANVVHLPQSFLMRYFSSAELPSESINRLHLERS